MSGMLLGRSIKIQTDVRCDYDHLIIPKGKFATQVVGDPGEVKAQGLYHGRLCYQSALADYNDKKEQFDLQEEVDG